MKYFIQELKRGIYSIRFLSVLIIGFIGVLIASDHNMYLYNDDAVHRFLYTYVEGSKNYLPIIMPLLVSFPYASSFLEDMQSGFIKNIYAKKKQKKYLSIKLCVNAIIGGLVSVIPPLTTFIYFLLRYAPVVGEREAIMGGALGHLYVSNPILYCFGDILLTFIFGVVFATISMGVSVYITNKFITNIVGFGYHIFSGSVLYLMGVNYVINLDGVSLFELVGETSFYFRILYAAVLLCIAISIFFIGNIKRGKNIE